MLSLTKSIVFNLAGLAIPLLLAAFFFPSLLQIYGVEKFGVITVIWGLVGYAGLLDMGMSKSLAQRTANLALGASNCSAAIATGFWLVVGVGLCAALVFYCAASLIAQNVTQIHDRVELHNIIIAISFTIPAVVISGALRGAYEGLGHFFLINIIRILLAVAMFVAPLYLSSYGNSIFMVVVTILVSRWIGLFILLGGLLRYQCSNLFQFNREEFDRLVHFGKWVMVLNIVSPLIDLSDRIALGLSSHKAAISYYTVPLELLSKSLIVPATATSALFPRFVSHGKWSPHKLLKYGAFLNFAILLPLPIFAFFFGKVFLALWLTPEFAEHAYSVLVVLSIGMPISAVGQILYSYLLAHKQGKRLVALQVTELILYAISLYFYVNSFSLPQMACLWLVRIVVDVCVLQLLVLRLRRKS